MNTLDFILKHKVITICRKVYGDDLRQLAQALLDGGVRLMEVTFDQADPDCVRKTGEAIRMLADTFGEQMQFGAGTVLTKEQVATAKDAGARYIISPNTDTEIIRETKRLGLVSIPGAMTPSEIIAAHRDGADLVKLFPAGTLGMAYIKDILAPISHVKLCATGGVTEENFGQYLALGFAGAGISGRLCDKKCIAAKDFSEITRRAACFMALADSETKCG